ncbi:signal peptide peptidase-like 2 [Arachis hypogaea]|uniref:signal peptide peptidase-like 2 n=1 Tax=Arachis hypogaea TaxID=3818 RepID=UPI000DEC3DEB|nr:signal peptide peptidase-like 2 [Arachis hypogaea]
MTNSIRGCISCILPCGALDVIRIVHSNGRIDDLTTRTINAADVMRAHPNHILKKYSPSNLLIIPPHADLYRGNIYFLVPLPPPPPPNQHATAVDQQVSTSTHTSTSNQTVLLSCAFLYGIFWVFVSKWWFHESVMIVVARGDRSGEDGISMLLSIIGFGDIILSGLLVAFSLRYDWLAKRNVRSGYFVWAMSAYGLGLLLTYIALNLMDGHGQPALLYIVPFTLGTFLLLEKKRGELNLLWIRGEPEMPCPHNQESQQ